MSDSFVNVSPKKVGIVGARGYVGAELIRLLSKHSGLQLTMVSSRELAGQKISDVNPSFCGDLCYENLDAEQIAQRDLDVLVLALPNNLAANYVSEVERHNANCVVIDLSADYRFDDTWVYGLPELRRKEIVGAKRISNPGCYASAMQLAIAPMLPFISGPVQCFGVSGYSGAGTSPSDKNDVEKLRDNLMPYSLANHIHEREVSRQLNVAIEFMPHVATHFRGITMTVNMHLNSEWTSQKILAHYQTHYAAESLIDVIETAPWVSRIAGKCGVQIGGFTVSADGKRAVVVSTLDNLLKGAASQALQNINLALGLPELEGVITLGLGQSQSSFSRGIE